MSPDPECTDKCFDIFQNNQMIVRVVVLGLNWFSLGAIFYGLILSRRAPISDSIHVNIVFNAILDFLSECLVAVVCYKTKLTRYEVDTYACAVEELEYRIIKGRTST